MLWKIVYLLSSLLRIYTVVTHLHVVDILAYIYCIFVHLTSLFEVLDQRSKQHMKFWFYSLSISYRLNCFIYNCHNWWYICSFLHEDGIIVFQEKKKEIWPSPMTKNPYTNKNSKTKGQHTQTPPKTSITQQLRTDLGRSVGVTRNPTGVVKPVYGIPTFPLTAKAV